MPIFPMATALCEIIKSVVPFWGDLIIFLSQSSVCLSVL